MILIEALAKQFLVLLLIGSSTALVAQENTAILCSDGIDNDGDGLIDCEDQQCINLGNIGCQTCGDDGTSFADVLIEYVSGCALADDFPEGALGLADYDNFNDDFRVFLGEGGFIKLGFTNNLIVNSGNNTEDIFVFEVGSDIEPMNIALRPSDEFTENQLIVLGFTDINNDGFYEFTSIGGAISNIDIDALMPGYLSQALKFNAIEIMDIIDMGCVGSTPGADVDAVCALTNLITDCAGVINGTSVIDECGECLDPNDPAFNMSCLDCAGVINGTSVIDECGECLDPNDPDFNMSCLDCAGVINGTSVIDECGECLDPNDPAFNMSCLDCAGVINGTSVIDECGECLDPNDPDFNDCVDCTGTINGTFIIDSCGVCLAPSDPNIDMSCRDCAGVIDGTMILDECGVCIEPDDPAFNLSCADCAGTLNGEMIMDSCGVCTVITDPLFNLSCVEFPDLYIPNVFTPNGDGLNDLFQVYHPQGVSALLELRIYNRWGDIVFSATDLPWPNAIWWDGTYKGEFQNAQVYIYFIEALFINGQAKSYSGDVTVLH